LDGPDARDVEIDADVLGALVKPEPLMYDETFDRSVISGHIEKKKKVKGGWVRVGGERGRGREGGEEMKGEAGGRSKFKVENLQF